MKVGLCIYVRMSDCLDLHKSGHSVKLHLIQMHKHDMTHIVYCDPKNAALDHRIKILTTSNGEDQNYCIKQNVLVHFMTARGHYAIV